ncbi:Deoxyhypusine synthase [Thelohanellus kitauei]|uniref:deoxyhypusine synthase n=1 Tax=Thelohanellus kitauei TaxID=669202 RepID=A0A0C2M759_THEKT|nr:Deoxyhypusine synthase [Thelohanellus kitauei]
MEDKLEVKGVNLNDTFDFDKFFEYYGTTGFQATHLHKAVEILRRVKHQREQPFERSEVAITGYEPKNNCTLFLGYTSNMVSSGNRELIRYLVQHRHVDVLVTTAGGIEEDLIKCLAPTLVGSFRQNDAQLRKDRLNRIGNLVIPSANYELFEDWITPIFRKMLEDQKSGFIWTPSKMIKLFGEEIKNESSICYWAAKNDIPIFSPAITDGSIGDMIYFFSITSPGLMLDICSDLTMINNLAKFSKQTGMLILGGGLIKHHICNANLMRNGADFSVFINTAVEYDGSDAGAEPSEAVSWGKIKCNAESVKVFCDATIAFPLIVAVVYGNRYRS